MSALSMPTAPAAPRKRVLDLTPFEVADRCRHLPGVVFFDSAAELANSPHLSLIAAAPREILSGHSEADWEKLREALRKRRVDGAPDDDGYESPPPPMETLIPPLAPRRGYRPPSRNVLKRSSGPSTQPASVIQETSRRLVETLGHFGVQAEVTEAVSGPRVTRYELQLAPGTKVAKVAGLKVRVMTGPAKVFTSG